MLLAADTKTLLFGHFGMSLPARNPMSLSEKCEQCGTPIAANPDGSLAPCPRCLLGLGQLQVAETMDHGSSEGSLGHSVDQIPEAGQLAGKFSDLEILDKIGQGGMGAVYRAKQISLDRTVALKILSPRLSADPTFVERFTREAQTLAKLDHANIVTVYNYGQADSMLYLVMEFVDGVNLRQAIKSGSISSKEALAIIPKICEALQFAHDEGVVHRDIKPENILLDRRGRIKIADFGLAKLTGIDAEIPSLTGTRQVLGTINYMAPEQIEGEAVDHRADIYSLGVVFYELLTGELPLGRFAAPSEKSQVGLPLDEVVLKALEKEPQKRYQQASEVKTAIENYSQADPLAPSDGIPVTPDPIATVSATAANSVHVPSSNEARGSEVASASDSSLSSGSHPRSADSQSGSGANKDSNVSWSLPFTISGLHHGMASATGLINVTPFSLDLEFQIKDEVMGVIKSKVTTARVPWVSIEQIQYKQGMFYDTVVIQANRLNALADLPNNEAGRVVLSIKKKNRDRGEEVIRQAVSYCQVAPGPGPLQGAQTPVQPAAFNMPSGKGSFQPIEKASLGTPAFAVPPGEIQTPTPAKIEKKEMDAIQNRLSGAGGAILAAAILNFILMTGSLRSKLHGVAVRLSEVPDKFGLPVSETLQSIEVAGNPFSKAFVNPGFDASVIVSIFFFIIYSKACSAKSYWWVVAGCCVALLPIYHTFILGVIGAISLFAVMIQPRVVSAFEQNDLGEAAHYGYHSGQSGYGGGLVKAIIAAAVIGAFVLGGIGMLLAPVKMKVTSPETENRNVQPIGEQLNTGEENKVKASGENEEVHGDDAGKTSNKSDQSVNETGKIKQPSNDSETPTGKPKNAESKQEK